MTKEKLLWDKLKNLAIAEYENKTILEAEALFHIRNYKNNTQKR